MNRLNFPYRLLVLGVLALLLAGCALNRPAGTTGDIDQIDQFAPPAEAAVQVNETTLRLQSPTQQLKLNETAAIEIRIDNVANLVAADIELQFNPAILQAQDADPNKEGLQLQPGDFLNPDFVAVNEVDNATGLAHYVLTQVAPSQPANGSGLLATITLQAVAQGNSNLTFPQATLVAGDGQTISIMIQSGQVAVGQPVQPTASLTPTLTITPGQPTDTPTPLPSDTPTPSDTPIPPPTATNTPIPPSAEIPPGATVGFCYRVQPGDTLYNLPEKFRTEMGIEVNPHHIDVANNLQPPGYIFVHQALFIPTQMGYGPNVYITGPYDTLTSVAEACHLPISFLAQVNELDQTVTLQEGIVLIIPIPPFPPPAQFPYPPSVFPGPY